MIYLIIASIEGREKQLKRLISSIQNSIKNNKYEIITIRQYKIDLFNITSKNLTIINTKSFGASHARNIGLDHIKDMIVESDWVCFPDDDCFFDKNTLRRLPDFANYDLVFGDVRDPNDKFRMGLPVKNKVSSLSSVFPVINCPSFFVKASRLKTIRFNERFGPGASIPAVEETEFLYRLSRNYKISCIYSSDIKIFHPYEVMSSKQVYWYAYSQGVLLKKLVRSGDYRIATIYFKPLCRPFVAYILNSIFSFAGAKFYKIRCKGLFDGFFKGEKN